MHQLWFTSADSSGNRQRLNPSRPSIPQGAFRGGLGRHKFKSLGKLSNGYIQIDWHQIWHKSADPSGNGYTPNCPLRHKGVLGGFTGQTFKSFGKLSNGWTDWHQLWFTSADSSGNGHRLNPSRPSIRLYPRGHFGGGVGGHKFKSLGKLSNGCTDWHQIWYTSADSSGNGHRLNTIRPTIPQGHFGGLQIKKSGEAVKQLDRLAPNLVHVCGFVWEWT